MKDKALDMVGLGMIHFMYIIPNQPYPMPYLTPFIPKVTDTLTPRSGKLNKICEREVEMYLER